MNLPKAKLSCDEATKLWIKERSEYAKEQLVLSNIGLVGMIMRQYGISTQDEDSFSDGIVGLVKAVNGFNASRDCVFSTYAVLCIKHELFRPFQKKRIKVTVSLDEPIPLESGDSVSFDDIVSDGKRFEDEIECAVTLKQFTEKLSEREREVLSLFKDGMTQSQTAKALGVSQAQISRTVRKMRDKYKSQNT